MKALFLFKAPNIRKVRDPALHPVLSWGCLPRVIITNPGNSAFFPGTSHCQHALQYLISSLMRSCFLCEKLFLPSPPLPSPPPTPKVSSPSCSYFSFKADS